MTIEQTILILIVAIPILLSPLIPVLGSFSTKLRNIFALLLALATLGLGISLAPSVLNGNIIEFSYNLPLGFNFILKADAFALFSALVSSFVSAIIVFYSFEYIKPYKNQNEYYFIVLLFLGSMMGIIFSANLIILYMFWEMTALASWRLIGFFRKDDFVRRANKAFLITAGGAFLMLAGFMIIFDQARSFDFSAIQAIIPAGGVRNIAVILILCGIFAKSATFPLHTWLADAGVAPSPVTALLHAAVLVKIGVYVFARLFTSVIIPSEEMRAVIFVIIALSALISGGAALIEKDIKRIIAFSTVSQLAFIFLGFAVGTPLAFAASMLFILVHSTAKAGLFLSAGIIEHTTHTKDISLMGGLYKVIPITAVAFLLCAASIVGVPPMGGFFSKFLLIAATTASGNYIVAFVFVLAATLTILYMLRVYYKVFLDTPKNPGLEVHKSSFWSPMNLSVTILAFVTLIFGLGFGWLTNIAALAAEQMFKVM